jgi:cell division protein FtsI (penicillin-binding protein 3)
MYPAGDVAKSLLGRVNVDGEGTAGLEKQYDSLLTGVNGLKVREIDGEGRSIPTGKRVLEQPVPGQDLVLTISRPLQYQAEQALIDRVTLLGARGGQVIVGNTKTGEIYALANVRIDEETGEVRGSSKNMAAVDANEPGSVAKVITIAAAMNEGTVTTDSYFQVPGYLEFDGGASRGGITLKDAHPHDLEDMSVETILGASSNIGTYRVMQTIGVSKHEQYLRAFGLGARSALGFPDEQKGIVHEASTLRGTEAVTVAWGQGVASTAVQLWAAINVIGNKGRYVEPKLIKSIIDAKGSIIDTPPSATREVVSESVADDMTRIMQTVVCKGTGKKAQVPGWDVAGKTGTSYKAQPKGGYKDENGRFVYFASFVGFFPADDPQVTVLVSIDEPPAGGDRFGGTTAAPVFTEIARAAINQLRIAPPVSGGCAG